ncbi:hypothetical protein AB4Y45_22905 [Paraburkholderia sp. EG287A]|uniref:hypothetical protein n=1 Tax=Paraburkholderia sp. EG287A TaxID=3237012 RepID=UPI0034D23D9C
MNFPTPSVNGASTWQTERATRLVTTGLSAPRFGKDLPESRMDSALKFKNPMNIEHLFEAMLSVGESAAVRSENDEQNFLLEHPASG